MSSHKILYISAGYKRQNRYPGSIACPQHGDVELHPIKETTETNQEKITMATVEKPQVPQTSEAHIAVHWKGEELYYPPKQFVEQANLKDPQVTERFSEKNIPKCFEEYADMLTWNQRWHTVLDTNDPPFWKWFVGGKLNASYNCVDRHLAK